MKKLQWFLFKEFSSDYLKKDTIKCHIQEKKNIPLKKQKSSIILLLKALRALAVCNNYPLPASKRELITNYVRSLVQMVRSDGPTVWTSPPTSPSDPADVTPGNTETEACADVEMEPRDARAFGMHIKRQQGEYELGVSDQCRMAAFKALWIQGSPPGHDLHGHDSVITRHVPVMGRWRRSCCTYIHTHSAHAEPVASMDTTWYSPFLSH